MLEIDESEDDFDKPMDDTLELASVEGMFPLKIFLECD